MVRNELVIEGGGEVLEAGQLVAFHRGLLLREDFRVERFLVFEQVPQDARQIDSPAVAALGSLGLALAQPLHRGHEPQRVGFAEDFRNARGAWPPSL